MPTTKKRLQITLSDDVYAQLKKLSKSSRMPMSKLVTSILDNVVPSLEAFAQIMEAAKTMSDEAPAAFAKDLEDAHKVLIGSLGYVDAKLDWGLRDTGILNNPLAINKGVRSEDKGDEKGKSGKTKGVKSKNKHIFLAATNEAK